MTAPSSATIGVIQLGILLNAYLFGVVSQQFCFYWSSGFKDTKRIKIFVVIQFVVLALEAAALWNIAWSLFVIRYGLPIDPNACTWETLTHSMCQCVLILFANMFLANRIYHLTNSRLQAGLVIAISTSAFAVGIVNVVLTWDSALNSSFLKSLTLSTPLVATSAVWYGLQAIAEGLITILLSRALLKARTGLQRSDSVVNYLIRRVIQTGFVAALWVVAESVTWFLLPKTAAYRIFDMTVGAMYTHVIFDTLLSRIQLRKRMAESTHVEIAFSESPERITPLSKGPNDRASSNVRSSGITAVNVPGERETIASDDSDVEGTPV
ncbi:hypothetical protein BGW80DRAFT_257233 [Lactifluus volemus]|nr:hypothetical protein BGW80DRAFT_257233 [Lactifluus volemus]